MKKKFRNEKGQLTVKLDEIGKLTQRIAIIELGEFI